MDGQWREDQSLPSKPGEKGQYGWTRHGRKPASDTRAPVGTGNGTNDTQLPLCLQGHSEAGQLEQSRKTDPPPPFPNSGAAETTAKQPQRQTPLLPAWDQGGLLSHRRTVPQTGAKGNSLETSVEAEVRSPEVGGELG